MNKNYVVLASIALIIILSLFILSLGKSINNSQALLKPESASVKSAVIAGNEISLEIAQTPKEKEQGLSGRESIPENHGMLFIISPKSGSPFWMIDMKFPLDIIWISDNQIVHIDENTPPPTPGQKEKDLPLYYPPKPVDYVLEVNGGFSSEHKIKVGDRVEINP